MLVIAPMEMLAPQRRDQPTSPLAAMLGRGRTEPGMHEGAAENEGGEGEEAADHEISHVEPAA